MSVGRAGGAGRWSVQICGDILRDPVFSLSHCLLITENTLLTIQHSLHAMPVIRRRRVIDSESESSDGFETTRPVSPAETTSPVSPAETAETAQTANEATEAPQSGPQREILEVLDSEEEEDVADASEYREETPPDGTHSAFPLLLHFHTISCMAFHLSFSCMHRILLMHRRVLDTLHPLLPPWLCQMACPLLGVWL